MAFICAGFVMQKPSGLLAVSVVLLMGAIAFVLPFPVQLLLFPQQTQKVLAATVPLKFRQEIKKPETVTLLPNQLIN